MGVQDWTSRDIRCRSPSKLRKVWTGPKRFREAGRIVPAVATKADCSVRAFGEWSARPWWTRAPQTPRGRQTASCRCSGVLRWCPATWAAVVALVIGCSLAGFSTRFFWGYDAEECQSLPLACHTQTLDLPHPNPWPATPKPLTCHAQTFDLPHPNHRPATPKPSTCHTQTLDLPHPNPWPATPKPLTCHTQTIDLPHPKPLTCHTQTLDLPHPEPWPATHKPLTCHTQTLDLPHTHIHACELSIPKNICRYLKWKIKILNRQLKNNKEINLKLSC